MRERPRHIQIGCNLGRKRKWLSFGAGFLFYRERCRGFWLSIGSDAHYCEDVGNFKQSLEILKEAGISPDDPHIINNSPLAILKLLLSHKHQNLQEVVDYFGLSL